MTHSERIEKYFQEVRRIRYEILSSPISVDDRRPRFLHHEGGPKGDKRCNKLDNRDDQ
jgi:hypothetical protein